MSRFFFHVIDGVALLDPDGIELADREEARRMAFKVAADLLAEESRRGCLGDIWRLDVTDHTGLLLHRLDISLSTPVPDEAASD